MLRDWHGDDAILRLLNSSCGSLMPLINLTYVRRGGGRPLLDVRIECRELQNLEV